MTSNLLIRCVAVLAFPLAAACLVHTSAPAEAAIVVGFSLEEGDYRDDYTGTAFPAGWQYLWNQPSGWVAGGSSGIGTSNAITSGFGAFALLQWTGTRWTADGDDTGGNNQPSGFAVLNGTGGHPALGSTQNGGVGNTQDRYVIAAYTVTQGGEYQLSNAFIDRDASPDTVNARVFVNSGGNEIGSAVVSSGPSVSMNRSLGVLAAGDTVYVAAGPDGSAGSDGFTWDFTVQQTRFDVSGDQTESNTDIRLIQEQTVTLASDLTVDRANPYGLQGTFGPLAANGSQLIAAGTEVTSYLLHFDPIVNSTANGLYTFDQEIVGLIFVPGKLDATDALLGLSSIIYPTDPDAQTTNFRGALSEATDLLIISPDRRTIDLTMFAGAGGNMDQIRILTAQAIPEPTSVVLALFGALALAVSWRSRRSV